MNPTDWVLFFKYIPRCVGVVHANCMIVIVFSSHKKHGRTNSRNHEQWVKNASSKHLPMSLNPYDSDNIPRHPPHPYYQSHLNPVPV